MIITSFIHFGVSLVYADNNEPKWLKEAKTYNFTSFGAELLKQLTNDYIYGNTGNEIADRLSKKLSSTISDSFSDTDAMSALHSKEVFKKVLKTLPKQDLEALDMKLSELGEAPTKDQTAELALEILILYKKAVEADLIKKEDQLSEDENQILERTIGNLQKSLMNDTEEEKTEDKKENNNEESPELPWLNKNNLPKLTDE